MSNSPTKKRKTNGDRATVPDGGGDSHLTSGLGRGTAPTASTCGGENLTQKMDAMMQMMSRMEERQLANMSSLERQCENLQAECNSLKNMVGSLKELVDCKFDKQNEYNSMLGGNRSWKYPVPVHSAEYWEDNGYDEDVATFLTKRSRALKDSTEKMRRGEFPADYSDGNEKGIYFDWHEDDPILDDDASYIMRPHWEEFANALKQFKPAFGMLPDGCETYFTLENIQLPGNVIPGLLKDALMNKPFQQLKFVNRTDVGDINEGMGVGAIMDVMESNKHLRKLNIANNRIQLGHIAKICSAVNEHSLVQLDLFNCFENGLGDAMITSLLRSGGLTKLERLGLESARITSSTIALLADFLATNPLLKELDLNTQCNVLNNNSAVALATSLRSNTSLRYLCLFGNIISDVGKEALRLVLHDDSSLNSIADSNHSCSVVLYPFDFWNVCRVRGSNGAWHEVPKSFNRARKIYRLLSERNKSTSNVQHFDEIDVKILPFMLKAVQRYASVVHPNDHQRVDYYRVEPLSIVYEVMRKWDKVFSFIHR